MNKTNLLPQEGAGILDKIVEQTREDLHKRKKKVAAVDFRGFELYQQKRRNFKSALRKKNEVRIIAEVKKASPSKGVIRNDFDPLKIAEAYSEAGAAALSVLTETRFFQGDLQYMADISRRFDLPVLRKDFIVDFYQIEEARAHGADAILLIAGITSGTQLEELHHAATEAGLQCLVECYDEKEFNRVDFEIVSMLGVNNRDLKTFEVDVHRGIKLLQKAPADTIKISESGLSKTDDLRLLMDNGIDAALIGEYFMRQPNPGYALSSLIENL